MGTSGDKIVLLDGMGSGSGSAANGLLSMIPGMFTSLLGGNKMDPNLVAALMNGRNNQDQFGGANGWWLWIIVLFWLWGGRGFGSRMDELERRERDLERRERELERDERELEKRERLHEREDEMYRRGWFGERGIRDEYEGTEPYMRRGRRSRYYWGADADDPDYKRYIDTHGYHFSKELAREAADKMLNADGSKRRWTMEDAKQMFDKCGAKKPDNATWGDVQYLFAMFYSDYFPKVLDCDQKIVKAVLAYLEDPDAPEGTAFVRYLAVRCFVGDTIKWSEMI